MDKWNSNCRFFNESYACETLTSNNYKSCQECKFASNYDKKILIIKLGALGDVIRTTPILEAIKEKYPESLIYWLIEDKYGEGKQLLDNPYIDKILIYNLDNILRLQQEKFDIIYSLEISTPGTLLANLVNAKEKYGYYFDNNSTSCFNKEAEEYLETAFLTHLKLKNRKTYQQLIFQACCLSYKKQMPFFQLTENDLNYSRQFKKQNKLEKDKILGINFGSGKRWLSKAIGNKTLIELIKKLKEKYKIILLAGPDEEDKLKEILEILRKENISIRTNNPKNSLREFASIINICSKIITTDSLTLHLSTALKKPSIALFFSTPSWEIEDYNLIKKLSSPLLVKNFFSMSYSEELENSISADEIIKNL